jgi:hypothetical protein
MLTFGWSKLRGTAPHPRQIHCPEEVSFPNPIHFKKEVAWLRGSAFILKANVLVMIKD